MFPTTTKFDTPYKRLKDIDLQSAAKKRKLSNNETVHKPATSDIPSPTANEENLFVDELDTVMPNAAALSLSHKFSENFKPKSLFAQWPIDLSRVCIYSKDTSTSDLSYKQVLDKCSSRDISVTKEQASYLERETKDQSNNVFWHRYHTGKITASNFYPVYHTNVAQPALTILKTICASDGNKIPFYSAAIDWGTKHEATAEMEYSALVQSKHVNFKLVNSGFIIIETYPQFGASPDGIISCECCGDDCLEIKCLYSTREQLTMDVPWLKSINNRLTIDHNHPHCYQMQMQMFLLKVQYCDFYVWCPHDHHYERIYRDNELWQTMAAKALEFHSKCVMPELLCKYFSRRQVLTPKAVTVEDNKSIPAQGDTRYCFCGGDDDERKMIMCENENCPKMWFHTSCIKLKRVPKGNGIVTSANEPIYLSVAHHIIQF